MCEKEKCCLEIDQRLRILSEATKMSVIASLDYAKVYKEMIDLVCNYESKDNDTKSKYEVYFDSIMSGALSINYVREQLKKGE